MRQAANGVRGAVSGHEQEAGAGAAGRSAGAEAAQADAERDRWAHHDALERGRPVRTFEGPSFSERR